ncbi:MAG TPA: hypothetical protein VIX37_21965, partial [Candidatus Sulfotelmatobacter sp.]
MKYSENEVGGEITARAQLRRPRTHLRMRMSRLRYRDSLRKNQAPLEQTYAEGNVDASDPFRLSSF